MVAANTFARGLREAAIWDRLSRSPFFSMSTLFSSTKSAHLHNARMPLGARECPACALNFASQMLGGSADQARGHQVKMLLRQPLTAPPSMIMVHCR